MCSLHLTHPSVHTWSSGQPTVQRPGSSRGLPVGAGIRTHNLGLPRVSSPTLYPLGDCHDDAISLTSSDPAASSLLGYAHEEQEMSKDEEVETELSQTSCPAYEELLEVM